jgi:hypothetical protein
VKLESFVPASHPLRPIRTWLNDMLANMGEPLKTPVFSAIPAQAS